MTMQMCRRRRTPLQRFLYIHGGDVALGCMAVAAAAIVAWDYLTFPHGFTRFAVAVVSAVVQ